MINKTRNNRQPAETDRPSMCRNCGAIVGGAQLQCAVCGTAVSSSVPPRRRDVATDNETVRFARAVLNRPYKFTLILLSTNVFLFTLMWQTSGMSFSLVDVLPENVLAAFGAKLNYLIHDQYQWWRFVTPMFLHVNLLHLLVNMYSLWIVGPYVEKLYGSAKFVVFWVLTGIAGVVASYLTVQPSLATDSFSRFIFKAYDQPSAGASGALFGLVGVLFVFGIKFRHELPEGFKRAFGTGLLPMILMNLFIGYVLRGFIDNAAHLGGMFAGALIALVVDYRRPGESSGVAITWRVLQVAAIALVLVSFVMVARHLRDPMPVSFGARPARPVENVQSSDRAFLLYAKAINDAQEALAVFLNEKDASKLDAAIAMLDQAPRLDQRSMELKQNLKSLLVRAKQPQPASSPTPASGKEKPVEADVLTRDYLAWRKEYARWLRNEGKTFSGLSDLIKTN